MGFFERILAWFGLLTKQRYRLLESNVIAKARAEVRAELRRKIVVTRFARSTAQKRSVLLARGLLPLTEALKDRIREDVELYAPKLDVTEDQWKMILSVDPATCVVAGAGSGKSTCLMLRVIVLHIYLKIPWSELVVFTFTRNSRKDLIMKLRELLAAWGNPISEPEAKAIVRTFHSMVLSMYRDSVHASPKILEYLNEQGVLSVADKTEVENLIAEEASEPLRHRLLAAYCNAFEENSEFRRAIEELYVQSHLQRRTDPEEGLAAKAEWVAASDKLLSEYLNERWRESVPDMWPLPNSENGIFKLSLSPTFRTPLIANAYISDLKAYVVLGGAKLWDGQTLPGTKTNVSKLVNTKRKIFAARNEHKVFWIDSPEALQRLFCLMNGSGTRATR